MSKPQSVLIRNSQQFEIPLFATPPFKRTSLFRQKSSPSKSDCSLSKFFVKQSNVAIQDPQVINKIIIKPTNLRVLKPNDNDYRHKTPQRPTRPPISSKKQYNDELLEDKYKKIVMNQTKKIQQLEEEVKKLYCENQKIQKKCKILQQEKKTAQENYRKVVEQSNASTSSFTYEPCYNQQERYISPISKIKNKFIIQTTNKVNQSSFESETDIFQQYSHDQHSKMNQKYRQLENSLFQAKQTIKRLTLQIDCVKMKCHNDLQKEKKKKNTQYIDLKKKFTEVLKEYTEIAKTVKKIQITKKIQNSIFKKDYSEKGQDLSMWSISSGD